MIKSVSGFTFNNPKLLTNALTHRSALNESKHLQSYERLEYLGDAVLELVVSDYLYKHFPQKPEGELTHLRAKIVQTKTLANLAKKLKLGEQLILSKGEKQAGGQTNISLLADVVEAVIGALYLDQGLNTAADFIKNNLLINLPLILKDSQITDYKSKLQEAWQKKYQLTPTYQLVKAFGPDHHKSFIIKVFVKTKELGQGTGNSKQTAQQQAAKAALEKPITI